MPGVPDKASARGHVGKTLVEASMFRLTGWFRIHLCLVIQGFIYKGRCGLTETNNNWANPPDPLFSAFDKKGFTFLHAAIKLLWASLDVNGADSCGNEHDGCMPLVKSSQKNLSNYRRAAKRTRWAETFRIASVSVNRILIIAGCPLPVCYVCLSETNISVSHSFAIDCKPNLDNDIFMENSRCLAIFFHGKMSIRVLVRWFDRKMIILEQLFK